MIASSGTLPDPGDVVRIDQRATDDVPAGARLRVVSTRASTIAGWRYFDVIVLDDAGEPVRSTSLFVPVASVTTLREQPDGGQP